jgi:hypothetical protein
MPGVTNGTGTPTLPEHLISPTVFSGVRVNNNNNHNNSLQVAYLILRYNKKHYMCMLGLKITQ